MRLIKQCFLYFKEGNSDKVYEIDLCDVGNDKYVVNFRYGRRGGALKEGSKTPVPVSLQEAEKIYEALAEEKINKGYTTSESGQAPAPPRRSSFALPTITTVPAIDLASMPEGHNKAILKRLQQAVQGSAAPRQKHWKLSRIIWKAGEYRIKEAVPFILQLFTQGDTLHQYVCTWALVRTGDGSAAEALQTIYKDHSSSIVSRIAGAGLLQILTGEAREQHVAHYLKTLPEAIQAEIAAHNAVALQSLLTERATQLQPQYAWLESLYLVSTEKRWLRPFVKQLLSQVPYKPNHFKHIRAIFKMAELLDDFEITGLLTIRIEREEEMYEHHVPSSDRDRKIFIPEADEYISPHKELLKKNSRLAYSQRTRWYLHRRVRRRLQMLGNADNTDYVKLATGLLISYSKEKDFKEAYSTNSYAWQGGRYTPIETRYPQNARAVFMHQILSGDHPELQLVNGQLWKLLTPAAARAAAQAREAIERARSGGGFMKKLLGLFGKKKPAYTPASTPTPSSAPPAAPKRNENGTPFLHLWNRLPQSYIQLLIEAEMEEIHEFAAEALPAHPSWAEIREKLDVPVYKGLLTSPFPIPAEFGYKLVQDKYLLQQPEWDLVIAMLNSSHAPAREKGKEWTTTYQSTYFGQSDFIKELLFARDADIRQWGATLIRNSQLNAELKKAVAGKAIATMMGFRAIDTTTEALIKGAGDALFELFGPELQEVPFTAIADLLQHPAPPVLVFGLRLLKANNRQVTPDMLSKSLLVGLLQHPYAPVREAGTGLLTDMEAGTLLKHQDEMIAACLSVYQNVRQGMRPVIARMAQHDPSFGYKAAELLMPWLMRKEISEGLHDDLSLLLCNELSGYLQNVNKETALNLLYGNYKAGQNLGVVILEKYTNPDQLTIPQVVALGSHENLTVRTWSWKFYSEQVPRIKYEKEAAVKLLESKWEDSRKFAMQFFRQHFTAADWSPEALITLADSVKPDVEAYGRELITRFFESENGVQYLLQLSQHPSEKMQLFATNYLERFAANDIEKIQSLEFYFRSVLTRVNKSRIAKNRIFHFLLTEGRKSETAARTVSAILTDISATAAIGDKAKCIDVLLQLRSLYEVETPLKVKPIETRMVTDTTNPLS
ncbi:MAG: WGR domain-containing protein [Niastella sp.]|nr:WGR domain-containing protein [Niastella sp.]